ncbi:Rap1-interacting factor 1 N terminal-domain-containing protein [Phaeosphaeria sp. MPI-PUGE-AT-0046c]|nr:Rap1-interacting factor 1 N terminal-domain-containing protein [Phaeosphaeria sp. MPI-PUGE-AT-0046c]
MVFSKFNTLSLRPPTPPKDLPDLPDLPDVAPDADDTLDQFLEDPFGELPVLPKAVATTKALLDTPDQSPSSDLSIPPSSASRQKRVNFELQTCAIPQKKALEQSWTPTRSSPLRPLPQTRVSKPLKSILKLCDDTSTPPPAAEGTAAHRFKTFAEMLDSIVKLLASAERPSRMDAYHSLQRTMQAYDKIPDDEALKRNMTLLTGFIRRDMQASSPTGTGLDSQMIGQALKLLMALSRVKEAAAAMDDDFCAFVLDRSIQVAADPAMPKIVVNNHLAALMQQNFRPKVMNGTRVERILDVLDTIHERVGGFSVQAYRIRIHRKLVQQRPEIMAKHTERWFKFALKGFVMNQKDINQSALDIAITAAKAIGHERHVVKACLAVLNRQRSDGDTVAHTFTKELERILGGDNAIMVPQIWAAVTILLRDSLSGAAFPALKEWLRVFEKCLGFPKDAVRVQANIAFGFLVYSIKPNKDTSSGWSTFLVKVPLSRFQQELPNGKEERHVASSGYLTLLYYALRPDATHDELTRYWRECVSDFWTALLQRPGSPHVYATCRIVSALLSGSRKPWEQQRVLDLRPHGMITQAELPSLDPKWVRKSLSIVLPFVEQLLEQTPWPENDQHEAVVVKTMWLSLLESVQAASSKEIVMSSETKDAMAHIVNLLRRVWERHTGQLALSQQSEITWSDKFCFLLESVVEKLGAFRFADKFLARDGSDEFEVASTPSHRSRHDSARISPLLYFFDLLANQSEGRLPDAVCLRALKLILEPCFNIQNKRLSRLELLRDCSTVIDTSSITPLVLELYAHLATLLDISLREPRPSMEGQNSGALGKEYDLVVEVLVSGSPYFLTRPRGHDVLSTFIETVRREAGESALVLAVIEKVSDRIVKISNGNDLTTCLPYITILLQSLPKQTNRRILEQERQNLWPSSAAVGRRSDFDPYSHLYTAIVTVGAAAYQDLRIEEAEAIGNFLSGLGTSIKECSMSHLAVFLRKIQGVVRIWVEDADRKMQTKVQPLNSLHVHVVDLWCEVTKAIERLPRRDSQLLLHLESLITSGFVSRRRSIVNVSIATWNKTFGQETSLRYPARLEQALHRLSTVVELSMPSLQVQQDLSVEKPSFYDSDDNIKEKPSSKSSRVKASPFRISKSSRRSTTRSPAAPASTSKRTSARSTPKVRLRHDNSQIQFEPIVSSPSDPFNQESQVLTERQKEMIERHRISGSLFANMAAPSPTPDAISSPMEIHSDAPTADDLPTAATRTTPRQALVAMGPMDAFLGSSPTPHGRRSTRQVTNDGNVTTPTAVRTVKVADNDQLNSSPPRFDKVAEKSPSLFESDLLVGSSFEYRQPESAHDASFDDGTTIDEDALLDAMDQYAEGEDDQSEGEPSSDAVMSEVPSSTIDLQLTAQLDADIQAYTTAATEESEKPATESNNVFVDAASHIPSSDGHTNQVGSDAEVDEYEHAPNAAPAHIDEEADTSSTSRVDDSFSKPSPVKGTPKSQSVRRSSRHSQTPSPMLSLSPTKRRSTPAKVHKGFANIAPPEPTTTETPSREFSPQPSEDGMLDNIIVVSPLRRQNSTKKRKSMETKVIVPETHRKRGPVRRSQSLLSQVENSQDILVEDTPAPKRARQSASQDVSDAAAKRLSHVQVTPKRSPEAKHGSVVAPEETATPAGPPEAASQQQQPGMATPHRSLAERVILTPRSIIDRLKSIKDYLFSAPQPGLNREEQREIEDVMFDIKARVLYAPARPEE